MKNQGVVKFFAVALVLVCIYQLSFTFKALSIESEAREATNDSTALTRKYLDSLSTEKVFNLLVKDFTYSEVKERQLNLGLDLQGGMNVVLEISVADIIEALANNKNNEDLQKAIAQAKKAKELNPNADIISEFKVQLNKINPNLKLAALFFSKGNSEYIKFTSTDDEVLDFIRKEASESVDRSFKILKTRIDQFGVTQPTIQLLSNSGRVMVELPGVDDPERVRRLLQGAAKLEFWNTYSNQEAYQFLEKANEVVRNRLAAEEAENEPKLTATDAAIASVEPTVAPTIVGGNDSNTNGDSSLLSSAAPDSSKVDSADAPKEFKKQYPIYAEGLQLNFSEKDGQTILNEGAEVGFAKFNDTADINRYLNSAEVRESIPSNIHFAWGKASGNDKAPVLALYALKAERDGNPALAGDVVTDARAVIGQIGEQQVSMSMSLAGAKKWEDITAAASATEPHKHVAIVLDNIVYSAPVVNGKIAGGQSSIEGRFSAEEAKDLANILKAGKMPAPVRIVEEAVVGPSLGQAAIESSTISILVGFLTVILIMFLVYNTAGLIADLAVLLNLFFIMGTLASFRAALTLPGIAGVILTLGMAVDANVLIYERIKEELELGRNLRNAISNGYKNAASAIIDSNVTTLLTAAVLAIFGTGPISGFAITLIIGIVSSLFTAFLLTRVVYEWMMKREKNVKFFFPYSKQLLKKSNFDFVGKSKIFYIISSVVILAGVISMFTKGFDLGVDFKGGWSYVVQIENPTNAQEIRTALAEPLGGAPEVKVYGTDNSFKITTEYQINSQDENASKLVESKLGEGINALGKGKFEILTSYKVGPTVADDIKTSAILAIVLALLGMFIYIQLRFRRWQFALATIVMLVHDVMLVLSLFSLLDGVVPFTLEIDQAFIAAILTIIGYSINDSVVVFDRVREYLREHKKEGDTDKVINMALNNTLSRTIMTSLTTIVVVFILFLFGGETIKGFAFALTVGIILGTYSSLCIGSPLSAQLIKRQEKKQS